MGKQVRKNPNTQDYTCVLTNYDMFEKRKRPRCSRKGQEGGDLHTVLYTAVEGDPEDGTFKLRPEGKEAAMGRLEQAEGQHV